MFFFSSRTPRRGVQDDDSDEDEEDEEEEEEEEEEDDEGEDSAVPGETEVSRAERRELKKKQAAERAGKDKQDEDGGKDEDDLISNPNHVTKKLNISDLSAPRELTRKERYVPHALLFRLCQFLPSYSLHPPPFFFVYVCVYSEQKEKQEAKDRYWKVNANSFVLIPHRSPIATSPHRCCTWYLHGVSCMSRARPTKLEPTCPASRRSAQNAMQPRPRGKPKLKVRVLPHPHVLILIYPRADPHRRESQGGRRR